VQVAEDDGELVAVVAMTAPDRGVAHVEWAHVRRSHRRRGLVKRLLGECLRDAAGAGATLVTLEALTGNEPALTVWRRLGFAEVEYLMAAPIDALERRLEEVRPASRASTHVQATTSPPSWPPSSISRASRNPT
jgi:ribosomal protein S18 acetylase RimI-like enzyme